MPMTDREVMMREAAKLIEGRCLMAVEAKLARFRKEAVIVMDHSVYDGFLSSLGIMATDENLRDFEYDGTRYYSAAWLQKGDPLWEGYAKEVSEFEGEEP